MKMETVSGKSVCLIGGAGFIGHNLALKLRALGAKVSVIDSFTVNNLVSLTANTDNVPHPELSLGVVNERIKLLKEAAIPLKVQDARDYHELCILINEIKPDIVVQLAAVSHANRSNKSPFNTFDHSFRTLENALDAARGAKVGHFIYMSSSMVYGPFNGKTVDEETICDPLGIYGALKYAGEKIVIAYNQVFGLPYTIVRPSALYGERCISRRVGQIFIENALMGKHVEIAGDGGDSLDFTYIEDLVAGLVRIMEHKNAKNEIFNLTYGDARTIGQMADILQSQFSELEVKFTTKDNLTPDRGTLSMEKAKDLLGFQPKWNLEAGYPKYIEWYKDWSSVNPKYF